MNSSTGRGFTSRAGLLLLALGGVDAARADTPVISQGTVSLQLGAVDRFVWSVDNTTQAIGISSGCVLSTGSTLMAVTSSGSGSPGFNFDSIGIYAGGSNGTPCSRVSVGEGPLRLSLGTKFAGAVVTQTSLDIEAKKNVVVKAVAYDALESTTTVFHLVTGTSRTNPAYATLPNADRSCTSASDSGPDSGASDNCRWNFAGRWTRLDLSVHQVGEFSLEGGADGTGASTFTIGLPAHGVLGCPSIGDEDVPEITGPNGFTSSGYRVENVDDVVAGEVEGEYVFDPNTAPDCVTVPYIYSATCPAGLGLPADSVCANLVYDPLDQGDNMAFYFTFEWPPEAVPPSIDDIDETIQFFQNGSNVPVDLDFCPGLIPLFDLDGNFTGIDPLSVLPPDQDGNASNGHQFGCLITREVTHDGETVQIVEGAYVQGDYIASRRGI